MIEMTEALEQLRQCCERNGYACEDGDVSETVGTLQVSKNGITVSCWFDSSKQSYGFNMIAGGAKAYDSITNFESYFTTYMGIYTDFIPCTKVVADKVKEDYGIESAYSKFVGKKADGYTAIFEIVGDASQHLRIKQESDFYNVTLAGAMDDPKKFKVLQEYKYSIDESGVAYQSQTIESYAERVSSLYVDSSDVEIQRQASDNEFLFTINNVDILCDVNIIGNNITYRIKEVNGSVQDKEVSLDNPYDLVGLYESCDIQQEGSSESSMDSVDNGFIGGFDQGSGIEGFNTEVPVDESFEGVPLPDSGFTGEDISMDSTVDDNAYDTYDAVEGTVESEETVEPETDTQAEEVEDTEDTVSVSLDKVDEESTVTEVQSESIGSSSVEVNGKMVLKLKNVTDGVPEFVQFITDKDIFDMKLAKAQEFNIPIERISEVVTPTEGIIPMSTDEKRMHVFSRDITDNAEICNTLYEAIFD